MNREAWSWAYSHRSLAAPSGVTTQMMMLFDASLLGLYQT